MKSDKKDFPYLFHPKLVLRTPRYAFKSEYNANDVKLFLDNEAFLEAIYLASPVLYRECLKLKNDEIKDKKDILRVTNSLIKYLGRMSSRSTPFGLFSGCSLIGWHQEKTGVIFDQHSFNRHTRLDMHYLCALAQKLAAHPSVKQWLVYFPNTSLYAISDELRYVEYRYKDSKRAHQISAVAYSEYLEKIIETCAEGKMLYDIAHSIKDEEIMIEEAVLFVDELIDVQILVSELEPAVTGKEFIYQILSVVKRINEQAADEFIGKVIEILTAIEQRLTDLDTRKSNPQTAYQEIIELITLLGVPFEESKLFQVDMSRKLTGGISDSLQESLSESFELLNSLYADSKQDNLSSFARRYYERYEDKMLPLLEVMDTETGLGYLENSTQTISPLIDGLVLPGKQAAGNHSMPFNRTSMVFFEKLREVSNAGDYEAVFTADDFKNFSPEWKDTPSSVSMMFRLVNDTEETILLESLGGSSAANLLGRFTHIDEGMHNLVREITEQEQDMNPEIIFAEIIHLPESRIGNIMLHTVFRDYEIPYLGKSSLDADHQIPASDLMIAVRNNKITLYSKKLGKEIIPRLSTAHNFSFRALPVYQFLCDLQTQGLRPAFKFNWGSISSQYKFLPRARYRHVILAPAQWQLTKEDLKELTAANDNDFAGKLPAFTAKWRMPRYVVLADGDNELLIDFENELNVKSWLKTVESRQSVLLKEFLHDTGSSICTDKGEPFVNQFIASLIKATPVYTMPLAEKIGIKNITEVKRKFAPGSEWVYYKWYCGAKTADKILEECITPLADELLEKGIIDKWFFIRYNDPHFHLRVRFHLKDTDQIGACINTVSRYIAAQELNGLIWRSQIDSYEREIERYGQSGIEHAESIFHADSVSFLRFLSLTDGDAREDIRWIWGLKAVDALLDDFSFPVEEKSRLLDTIRDSFAKEFNVDKSVKTQINKKYADHRNLITSILSINETPDAQFEALIDVIKSRSEAVRPFAREIPGLAQKDNLSLGNLIGAYLHMMLNRLFIADARIHEMMVYHIMSRYYQSVIAQAKNVKTENSLQEII